MTILMRCIWWPLLCGVLVVALAAVPPSDGMAQELETVPTLDAAEEAFAEGVEAFERSNYEAAYARFMSVEEQPLNRQTTAALLMAGKALYQIGEYEEAMDVLNRLIDRYPDTRYQDDAEEVRDFAREALEQREREPEVLRLGVALPMEGADASLAQAMFNGIRLAVEERNGIERELVPTDTTIDPVAMESDDPFEPASEIGADVVQFEQTVVEEQRGTPEQIVQLYFRATDRDPDRARAAVDSLVQYDGVDAIIGPLYSEEARAAAGEAETARVPLIAPMATDERVSEGRQYVFQSNPTMRQRGAVMARHAVRGMLLERVGIIREQGDALSTQMAEGFEAELLRQGGRLSFDVELPHPRAWSRMPEYFEEDTLAVAQVPQTEAVYVPVAGDRARGRIQDAVVGIDRMGGWGLNARILGNRQWHGASVEQGIYTNDFYVDETRDQVQTFVERYRMLAGESPDELSVTGKRLAYTGYDVADFLLRSMEGSHGSLANALREADPYEGLGIRIDFAEGPVNESMFIHRYRNNRMELVR